MRAADNPFRSDRLSGLGFRLQGAGWEVIESRLDAHHGGAVVGPRGSGKSTLLAELGVRQARQGRATIRLRLSATCPRLSHTQWLALMATGSRSVVLLDGAEQLGTSAWRALVLCTRRAAALVITQHHPGRLPVLVTCRTSPQLLAELVDELLPEHWRRPSTELLQAVYQKTAGNLREALGTLYDRCACLPGPEWLTW